MNLNEEDNSEEKQDYSYNKIDVNQVKSNVVLNLLMELMI